MDPAVHRVDRAAPALLKTIEEPPPTTVFVLLADRLAPVGCWLAEKGRLIPTPTAFVGTSNRTH